MGLVYIVVFWWLLRCTCIANGVLCGFGGHLCHYHWDAMRSIWLEKMESLRAQSTVCFAMCFFQHHLLIACCWPLHVFTAFCFPQDFCSKGCRPVCLNFAMVFQAPQVPKKAVKQIKKDDPAEKPFAQDPLFIQRRLLTSWPVFKLQQKLTYLKNHSETWLS